MKRPGGFDSASQPSKQRVAGKDVGTPERAAKVPTRGANSRERVKPTPAPVETWGDLSATATVLDAAADLGTRAAAGTDLGATTDLDLERELEAKGAPSRAELDIASEDARNGDPVKAARKRLKLAESEVRDRLKRETRRFTAHSRRRRRYVFAGIAAVLGLALFVVVGVFTPIMAVRDVQVVGATQVNVDDVTAALSRFEGVPLALVNDDDVHRALEPFPLIERYSVERIPPGTLLVRIEERSSVIGFERNGQIELVDPAGVLLARSAERPEGVPLGDAAIADVTSPGFLAAGAIIRDMPADLRSQLQTVTATSAQDVTFGLVSGTEVIWGEAIETNRKAAVLRVTLQSVGNASLIDVSAPDTPVFK